MADDHRSDTERGDSSRTTKRLGRRRFLASAAALAGTGLVSSGASALTPYGGSRHAIPGRIEAENYDTNGPGIAYHDTTAGNSGGAYRSDDVDIEPAATGGYNVGWTAAGEWLNYSCTVQTAGTYEVTAHVASVGGGSFVLEQDQADLATFTVPDTGGWQTWTTVTREVDLDAGNHLIAVYFYTDGVNLDWLDFSLVGGTWDAIAEGTYSLVNVNSGLAMDVAGASTADGANVQQWLENDCLCQEWIVEEISPGLYTFTASHSGKVLDVEGIKTVNGANIWQWHYEGTPNQHWHVDAHADGSYSLIADHSGKAAEVAGWSTQKGGNVQQWNYHGGANQRWFFEPVNDTGGGGGGVDKYPGLDNNTWNLTWSDEFDQGYIDPSTWSFDVGGGCGQNQRFGPPCPWGNNEEEYYTDGDNAWVQNGRLIIEAREELAPNGVNPYTSARMITAGKFEKQYGRIEVRARLPEGQGIWPAIWMLGHDIGSVGWPTCGEIDVMELLGHDTNTVYGNVHGPGYAGANSIGSSYSGPDFSNGFHDFIVTWYPDAIKCFVDGNLYHTVTKYEVEAAGHPWVFQDEFFLILNVAVGGLWPGYPDASTTFPQRMEVEYVRVYDWV